MTVEEFRDFLTQYPPTANLELGKLFVIPRNEEDDEPDTENIMELWLDFPILGAAYDERANDVRLVIEKSDYLNSFGELKEKKDDGDLQV